LEGYKVGTLVLNLLAGPGVGKSTVAAGVFSELKLQGVNCEMAMEFAKDKVWEESRHLLDNQISVFGEQFHRIHRLLNKVDIVICDSPLLNSIAYYRGDNPYFAKMVYAEHSRLDNLNVYLERRRTYNPAGRCQTEEEAHGLDKGIERMLDYLGESYIRVPADRGAIPFLAHEAYESWRALNALYQPPEGPVDRETLEMIKKW
jgi:hypothetical protein